MRNAVKIDLPHIVVDVDRHGNARVYVRMLGRPKVRIRETPDTPAFLAAYQAAVAGVDLKPRTVSGERRPALKSGTIAWLARQYFASQDFLRRLEPQTQRTRRAILEQCLAEAVRPNSTDVMGDCPLPLFSAAHVRTLRDRKGAKLGAARNRVKALKALLAWGIEHGHCGSNPARDVRATLPSSAGFHSWSPDEVAQFEAHHAIGSKARLAMALLLFTGQRRGDVVTFGRQHVRAGALTFVQRKTRKRRPEAMTIPLLPCLQEIIDASPTGDLTFLVTAYGKGFTAAGFGNRFREWCDEAGLPKCSAHGLRKAGATVAAERGATERQLMAIFGWTKAEMASHYTRTADQKRLAADAMHLLAHEQIGDKSVPPEPKVVSHLKKKKGISNGYGSGGGPGRTP